MSCVRGASPTLALPRKRLTREGPLGTRRLPRLQTRRPRAFRAGRADSIGVVVARLSYQLYPAMLEAIGAQLARLGQRMIVWDSDHGGDAPAIRALRQGVVPAGESAVVLLNRVVKDYASDQVESDNLDGGRRVAEYLVACGRKRIALVGGVPRASTIRDREQGFRKALAKRGVELSPHHCFRSETFSHASGVQAAGRLLELASPPDAIFCVNDVLAMGAMDGARARGVRIPEDLWIVGYDDMIAADPHTRNLLALADKVAETDATVLLTGESGTGKEVFARYLHEHSPRRKGAFVAINCAAIPDSLLEATLFGTHGQGAAAHGAHVAPGPRSTVEVGGAGAPLHRPERGGVGGRLGGGRRREAQEQQREQRGAARHGRPPQDRRVRVRASDSV